ncbi:tape measure protein [Buttiauxella gaviniae]|uniref:tape measure protein n=1 Tax=Buttiauxella gaviniae TaxID=82990 RepID=UPI0039B05628
MAANQNAGSIVYEVDMDLAKFLAGQRQVSDSLNGMNRGFDSSTRSINNAERSASSATRSFSSLTKVAAALTAALSVQQVAQYADAWVTVNNKLANAIRPSEELADVTQRVFDISQKTRSSLEATATLYARLERATRSAGTSTADLVKLTETINKGLAVSGATAEEASSTMVQLSQALASGVLRGEEFNSISENGSRLAVGLADSLGVTVGQLRAMAAQGQLTTDIVVKGLLSQGDQIAKEFANTTMTMGQAFAVATNNVTKFVGESSTIKSAYNGFNSTIVTLSQNLDVLAGAFVGLGLLMGSRFAGALSMATAAQVKNTIASIASAKASAESAAMAEAEASAKLRIAQADKSAAVSALNLAQARLNVIKATAASEVEEVKLATAEVASIRTNIALIESEKALETQRLKAQISTQGRIATATRMAQLQQASAVLNAKLASTEMAAEQARSSAVKAAEAQVSAARLTTADATGVATAANGRYIASQEASAIATRAASASTALLRGALGLIGGPAGVAMIAAAAVYYFWQKAQQAKQESLAFADGLDKLNASMSAMSNTSLRGSIADANAAIKGQKDVVSDLKNEIAALTAERNEAETAGKKYGTTIEQGNGLLQKAANLTDQIAQKQRDLESVESKLTNTTKARDDAQITLNNNMLSSMGIHDGLIQKGTVLEGVQDAVAKAFGNTADEINRANQAGQNFKPASLQVSPATAKGSKYITDLEDQNELLSIQDERLRAVTKAGIEAAKVTDNPNQIAQAKELAGTNYDLQKAEEARKKATQESASETKKAGNNAESVAQKLANLKQQSELVADSTKQLSREQSILNAQQSLGTGATPQDIALAGQYAAAKWDTANAIRAQAAAEKLLPEAKESASYKQSVEDLKTALTAKAISQEQYNATSERLEKTHMAALAKIRADQAVSPMQEAAGSVDPVQALANQHAQQLALIQQFEQQGVITHQNALAQRNALDTVYEQQRIAAQWEIFKNQSQSNQILAAGFESLAGNASNAFTGIITQSMTAEEAMSSLASNALNSLINGFVQMGVEWVKSAITGSAAQVAATAATTSAAVAGTATTTAASVSSAAATTVAWTPAAIVASIGSFGGAAAIGIGAVIAAMALSSSLAGKRKNGGPVSAGSMYQVGEGGMPEIYQASSGKQFMIPGDNGKVISNKDMQSGSGGGGGVVVNINNYTSSTVDAQATPDGKGGWTVDAFVYDISNGGPASQAIEQYHQAPRKARG